VIQFLNCRYCEAIAACLNRAHALPHPELSEQLRELANRLIGAPHLDKTGSWIRGKMTRPSLDSLGNWLGGRLTEFVAGGDDSPTTNGDTTPHESRTFAGPFSHYSTITSSTTSKVPSPQPTTLNQYALPDAHLPRRTGSAQAVRLNPQVQIDRASSAMEYRPIHRNSSPAPRIASASATTTHFAQTSPNYSGYPLTKSTNGPYQPLENEASDGPQGGAWWDSSNTEDSSSTPVVTMFPNGRSSPPSGFMSLMDVAPIPAIPTSNIPTRSPSLATHEDEDDDDLGLGNSSNKHTASSNDSGTTVNSALDPKTTETDTRSQSGNAPLTNIDNSLCSR
jgi:COPII coat assembly protein SEC16